MASIKCGFWNIHGHMSQQIGDKLKDPEFYSVVSDLDIIGLGELHSESEVNIPGFINKKQKIREKKFNGPKIAGGIGLFVRDELDHLVQVVKNDCDDSIWVKIKTGNNNDDDIYLGTYYVSPDNSKSIDKTNFDFFAMVNNEISYFSKKGVVLVQRDINSRVGQDTDYVEGDKSDEQFGVENFANQNVRNSEDHNKNTRGDELLDICKLNDMLILNGRTTGDIFGKFTSHNWNGSSVVDYCIVPNQFYEKVSEFSVGDYIPWLSDHCVIKTTFDTKKFDRKVLNKTEPEKVHPGFLWNDISRENYKNNLLTPYFNAKFRELVDNNMAPINLANSITSLLLENCKISGIKTKRATNGNKKDSEPWSDKECEEAKKDLKNLANNVSRSPHNLDIRNRLGEGKKSFKRIIKIKKRRYKHKAICDLEAKKHEGTQKEFWNLFRKISPKTRRETNLPSLDKFVDHFKKISNSSRPQNIPPKSNSAGPLDHVITLEELLEARGRLKLGKASGNDIVSNEMITALVETHPTLVIKLFNGILQSSEVVPDWVFGMIVPLFKDGSRMDANNYRGITLMSCLGKLFLSILNARLTVYAVEHSLLTKSALGFVAGNRCSDAHIIIHNLVKKFCHGDGSKIYSCFVDFKKAFDSVPRDLLLNKLLNAGVTGKFFNIIRHIYTSDKACVKTGNTRSDFFGLSLGVRQGCILSPLLFNIF